MARLSLTILIFFITYCGLAFASVVPSAFLGSTGSWQVPIWAATALLIAVLLHANRRQWLLYIGLAAIGSAIAVGFGGAVPVIVAVSALAHASEGWIAATLLKRRKAHDSDLLQEWLADAAAIGVAAPIAGASLIAAAAHFTQAGHWPTVFVTYALTHSLGNLALFPLFNLIVGGQFGEWLRTFALKRQLELLAMVCATGLISAGALLQPDALPHLVPILLGMIIVYRFGMPAASLAIAAMVVPAILLPAIATSPLPAQPLLQFSLFAAILCLQPLARHTTQNRRLALALNDRDKVRSGTDMALQVKDFAIGESQGLYRLLAENMTDIVIKTDREGHVIYASPSIERMGGLHPTDLLGRHVAELVHPSYDASFMAAHDAVIATGQDAVWTEYLGLSLTGEESWFDTKMRCVKGADGRVSGVVTIMRSIEERKVLEQQLFAATLTDPLTNLTNRRAFHSMLQYHMDVPLDGCLAMFDIDDFRSINRDHGHETGDKVLTTVAKLLRTLLRKDDIISRIGGERFAVLLSRASPDQAEVLCQRIVSTLSDMSEHGLGGPRITVSAGVARIEGTLDETMKRADAAVVIAKAKGRNRLEMGTRGRLPWSPADDHQLDEHG